MEGAKDAGRRAQAALPCATQRRYNRDREGTGEVDGHRRLSAVQTCEFACLAFHGLAQLDGPRCAPELLPGPLESRRIEVAVPASGRESSPNLGVCQPARDSRVAAVPKLDGEGGSRLFHDQLHQDARVEVDKRHLSDVAR